MASIENTNLCLCWMKFAIGSTLAHLPPWVMEPSGTLSICNIGHRCVIMTKGEGGFGLTFEGDDQVFVQAVKSGDASKDKPFKFSAAGKQCFAARRENYGDGFQSCQHRFMSTCLSSCINSCASC
ncbi:hypothetical protein M514_03438 [Trichuris suis]|uniref:PDZ domain-containing protein n=1 Tax=Trichuris suis TaxID=68888 RepID=A0A085NF55_9BILA|nr:hypothetical protein M513_03438 [Trichuris suis]KFD68101.1 hypothetical protein M514_03438 [Trichuris suis]